MRGPRAALAQAVMLGLLGALDAGAARAEVCAVAPPIEDAAYLDPSTAYGHGAVANGEWAHLRYRHNGQTVTVAPLEGAVFEGPRPLPRACAGTVFAVESSLTKGSRVVEFDGQGKGRPFSDWIGQPHRWLSLVGQVSWENASQERPRSVFPLVIDRPHLLGDLVVYGPAGPVGAPDDRPPYAARVLYRGVTNHRLGAADTVGGMRYCPDQLTSVVLATMDWAAVLRLEFDAEDETIVRATRFEGTGPESFAAALACD